MKNERGQILPLFAILLIGLFAIAALAVDVSGTYAARQAYRTTADAASLAGAQDLQVVNREKSVGEARTLPMLAWRYSPFALR